ncbi:MAG TPA: hypothetical protein EYQ26_13995 [Rhodospirillales bacterium]|nr:hypothetical protein [Rhodospirillales bacterium]
MLLVLTAMAGQGAYASDYSVLIDYRSMDKDWPLLPAVPSSFQSARDINFSAGAEFSNFGFEVGRSNLDLELARAVEPKDISLAGQKNTVSLFYKLSGRQKITFHSSRQNADEQRFECYGFSGIVIGSCEDGDIQIDSTNSKYDGLEGDLVAFSADTKTNGISFSQTTNSKWIDSFTVGVFSTTHKYDWLTPVEELTSPFILGLVFNGKTLGDAITETFRKFPQRDEWRFNQLDISGSKSINVYGDIEAFTDVHGVYLHHSNYKAVAFTPNYNVNVRVGLRYEADTALVELYGNYYHHNLIGFEPITFNQRTEHYFDRPYGNVGVKMGFRF